MATYTPTTTTPRSSGEGWRMFAGIVIAIVGIFNFIDGIVAIENPHYIAIQTTGGTNHLVFGSLYAWGWAILVLGVIQVITAFFILSGRSWAAVVGIIVAGFNAIGQLLYLGVNPWWSVIAIALDVLVIYGLAVYGFGDRVVQEY